MLYKTQQANEVNVGIISDALQNSAEAITNQTNRIQDENVGQHVVSSVIVNNVGEDLATMEFENLSENVNNVGEDLATMELDPSRIYQRMLIMLNNIGRNSRIYQRMLI